MSDIIMDVSKRTGEAVGDLLQQNFAYLVAKMDAEDKDTATASVSLAFERGPAGYRIDARLSWTSKHTDELELFVDRPDQIKIDFKKALK